MEVKIGFGSDNHSGALPEVLQALSAASIGHQPSYGTDIITERAQKIFANHFGEGTEGYFVFNGTAANVLAIESCARPYQAVICANSSHLQNDECGAPERFTGAKLITIPTSDGKITVEQIKTCLTRRGDQHHSQPSVVSITQPTELGTLYSIDEMKAIADFAHANGLYLHVDGARLVNAAVALNASLKEITRDVGVDVLSLGGTKNGLVFGEAVLFFKSELARDFKYRRKQAMQLPSKTRFIAAQFEAWLGTDLWKTTAGHANHMAQLLADGLAKRPFLEVTQKVQANGVFVKIPRKWVAPLREKYFFYVWNEATFECRLMTSFDTQEQTISGFLSALDELHARETK